MAQRLETLLGSGETTQPQEGRVLGKEAEGKSLIPLTALLEKGGVSSPVARAAEEVLSGLVNVTKGGVEVNGPLVYDIVFGREGSAALAIPEICAPMLSRKEWSVFRDKLPRKYRVLLREQRTTISLISKGIASEGLQRLVSKEGWEITLEGVKTTIVQQHDNSGEEKWKIVFEDSTCPKPPLVVEVIGKLPPYAYCVPSIIATTSRLETGENGLIVRYDEKDPKDYSRFFMGVNPFVTFRSGQDDLRTIMEEMYAMAIWRLSEGADIRGFLNLPGLSFNKEQRNEIFARVLTLLLSSPAHFLAFFYLPQIGMAKYFPIGDYGVEPLKLLAEDILKQREGVGFPSFALPAEYVQMMMNIIRNCQEEGRDDMRAIENLFSWARELDRKFVRRFLSPEGQPQDLNLTLLYWLREGLDRTRRVNPFGLLIPRNSSESARAAAPRRT